MDTVFIDESKTKGYTLVAVTVPSESLVSLRKQIALLRKPGQARVHMVKESDPRRRLILSTLADLGLRARVYSVSGLADAPARAACLRQIVEDTSDSGATRLVLERDVSIEKFDRQVLRTLAESQQGDSRFTYCHESASAEPLLWVPDAIAWAFARGGEWKRRITPLVVTRARQPR
ncbi:hypothetical protein C5B96_16590 [Subtercola sp. Z020]|uniref:hypothetical protein n=1 Tax=Subtercola sp. Z020 TaxID=2080582 RepID=UPI000CE76A5C|nr:hypothetical protein [Subtercola sp. Z020]PPF76549.1 hypothetical protein C5B96_16590 [Subtercola sp. Z020]